MAAWQNLKVIFKTRWVVNGFYLTLIQIREGKDRNRQEIIIYFMQIEGREVKHQCHLDLKHKELLQNKEWNIE